MTRLTVICKNGHISDVARAPECLSICPDCRSTKTYVIHPFWREHTKFEVQATFEKQSPEEQTRSSTYFSCTQWDLLDLIQEMRNKAKLDDFRILKITIKAQLLGAYSRGKLAFSVDSWGATLPRTLQCDGLVIELKYNELCTTDNDGLMVLGHSRRTCHEVVFEVGKIGNGLRKMINKRIREVISSIHPSVTIHYQEKLLTERHRPPPEFVEDYSNPD